MSVWSTVEGAFEDVADAGVKGANWIRDVTAPPKPRSSVDGVPWWAWAVLAYVVLKGARR
jgi:hypothetical protein